MQIYNVRKKDSEMFAAAVIGLAAVIFAAGVLMYVSWCDYTEKMEVLYVTIAQQLEDRAPIDIVAGLLKGVSAEEAADAKKSLARYGYNTFFADHYKKSLYRNWTAVAAVCSGLYIVFMAVLTIQARRKGRKRAEELRWLQGQVTALRDRATKWRLKNGCTGQAVLGFDLTGSEGALERGNAVKAEFMDTGQDSFMMELSALADSIALFGEQAEREKEGVKSLVTDISHQLKTPVAALKTSFEVLHSGQLTKQEHQEFLGRCSVQLRRLEELAAALVNVSRLESGLIALNKEKKPLFDTLLLAVNRIYPKMEEAAVELELEAEEALQSLLVEQDTKWLCEAFLNVLENAVKYSEAGTKITIRMMKMTVYLRIEIEDEGIGVPKEEQNRIFQRFYRGTDRQVQQASGAGIGLYLAREIVTRHEGTLTVTAPRHQKRGSCFVFQLPWCKSLTIS